MGPLRKQDIMQTQTQIPIHPTNKNITAFFSEPNQTVSHTQSSCLYRHFLRPSSTSPPTRKVIVQPFLFCRTADALISPSSILLQSCHTTKTKVEVGNKRIAEVAESHTQVERIAVPRTAPQNTTALMTGIPILTPFPLDLKLPTDDVLPFGQPSH